MSSLLARAQCSASWTQVNIASRAGRKFRHHPMRDPLAGRAGISVGSFRGGWCRHRIFARCETAGMFVSARSSDSKCAFSNLSRGRRARFFVHQPDIS